MVIPTPIQIKEIVMCIRSKWLVVLIGNNETGKTRVNKKLVKLLAELEYLSLPSNQLYDLSHANFLKKHEKFFVGGRSYQELVGKGTDKNKIYNSISEYFELFLSSDDASISFISSHLKTNDLSEILTQAHRNYYNVCGVFFTNSTSSKPIVNQDISQLIWDERLIAINPRCEDEDQIELQLGSIADSIVQLLIERTRGW